MRAIAAKELESYYNTMTGYVYMAICLLVCGIFFASENIRGGSASFLGVVSAISYVLILITPILTMKSFAEEKKSKTDQMYLTAPISITKVVLGKYFAALAVLLITLVISFIFPAILYFFGKPYIGEILLGYLGIILIGGAFIAIGIFISSISVNQLSACVSTLGILLFLWLMDTIVPSLSNPILTKVYLSVSLYNQFNNFQTGVLSISSIVYFLTLICLCLFFTVKSIEKRRWSKG